MATLHDKPRTADISAPVTNARASVRRGILIIGAALLALALCVWLVPHGVELASLVLLAVLIAATLIRPQWALFALVVLLPLHNFSMTLLFDATQNATFVRVMQPWKEIVLVTALLRAGIPWLRRWWTRRTLHLHPLDWALATFVLLCALSVVLPSATVPLVGRLYGFRLLVFPLAAYIIGRLVTLRRSDYAVLVGLLAVDVGVFGLFAFGERLLWGNALPLGLHYGNYVATFFGSLYPLPANMPYTYYMDGYYPRTGSLALDPLDVSLLLMVALPVVLAAVALLRPRLRTAYRLCLDAALIFGGVAVILAWGRASLALIALAFVLLLWRGSVRRQWRGIALTLSGCVIGAMLLFGMATYVERAGGIAQRIATANTGLLQMMRGTPLSAVDMGPGGCADAAATCSGDVHGQSSGAMGVIRSSASSSNVSTGAHMQSLAVTAQMMIEHPLGRGIGAAGQVGARFQTGISGESAYLPIGVELGVLGMLLYVMAVIGATLVCWRVAFGRRASSDPLVRAVFFGTAVAWIIVALNGLVAQVTLNMFVMDLLWWLTGVAVTLVLRQAESNRSNNEQMSVTKR